MTKKTPMTLRYVITIIVDGGGYRIDLCRANGEYARFWSANVFETIEAATRAAREMGLKPLRRRKEINTNA